MESLYYVSNHNKPGLWTQVIDRFISQIDTKNVTETLIYRHGSELKVTTLRELTLNMISQSLVHVNVKNNTFLNEHLPYRLCREILLKVEYLSQGKMYI